MTPEEFEELMRQAQANPQPAQPAPAMPMQPQRQLAAAPPPMAPAQPQGEDISALVKESIAARSAERMSDRQGLDRAYGRASDNRFGAELGSAGSDIGYAIAGVKNPNPNGFDDLRKNANIPIQQEEASRKLRDSQRGEDPNSARSLTYKNILQKTYPERFKGNDLEGVAYDDAGIIDKLAQGKESIDARRQASADSLQARKDAAHEGVLNRQATQNAGFSFRDQQLQERNDNRSHENILSKIKGNKNLNDSITKSQNLVNTINNIEATGKITPQDMADVQSLAIANMGIGGASSAHERSERYAKTLGIKAADAMQFLTGTPQDIGKDNPLFSRYKDIMMMEVENFRSRVGQGIKGLRSGHESIYKRRPDLSGDIDALESDYLGQIPQGKTLQPMPQGGGAEKTATNPKTGQKLILKDGKWQPI